LKNKKHENFFFIQQVFLRNLKTAVGQIQFQIGQNGSWTNPIPNWAKWQ